MLLPFILPLLISLVPQDAETFASEHRIVYQSFRNGDFSSSIIISAPDGSADVDLTPMVKGAKPLFLEPAFSPQGTHIAYVAQRPPGRLMAGISHSSRVAERCPPYGS